jgi:hypothetical protein
MGPCAMCSAYAALSYASAGGFVALHYLPHPCCHMRAHMLLAPGKTQTSFMPWPCSMPRFAAGLAACMPWLDASAARPTLLFAWTWVLQVEQVQGLTASVGAAAVSCRQGGRQPDAATRGSCSIRAGGHCSGHAVWFGAKRNLWSEAWQQCISARKTCHGMSSWCSSLWVPRQCACGRALRAACCMPHSTAALQNAAGGLLCSLTLRDGCKLPAQVVAQSASASLLTEP